MNGGIVCRRPFLGADIALLLHPAQNVRPAAARQAEGLGRAVNGGRARQAREKGGLGKSEIHGFFTEVNAGRGLNAVGTVAVVNLVQIHIQDFALIEAPLDPDGEDGLPQFPANGLFRGEEERLGELLRDRAPPLDDVSHNDVLQRGPENAEHVDARMFEKPRVLGRKSGLNHHAGDLCQGKKEPALDEKLLEEFSVPVKYLCYEARPVGPQQPDVGKLTCGPLVIK